MRFWKKASPPPFSRVERTIPGCTPFGQRSSVVGRRVERAHDAVLDGEVVLDDVELGDRGRALGRGEDHAIGAGHAQVAPAGLDDRGVGPGHARSSTATAHARVGRLCANAAGARSHLLHGRSRWIGRTATRGGGLVARLRDCPCRAGHPQSPARVGELLLRVVVGRGRRRGPREPSSARPSRRLGQLGFEPGRDRAQGPAVRGGRCGLLVLRRARISRSGSIGTTSTLPSGRWCSSSRSPTTLLEPIARAQPQACDPCA